MNIAIDYDDTYTSSPKMFNDLILIFMQYGHSVYIVTYRDSTQFDDMDLEIRYVRDYIFTSGTAKQKYCEDNGLNIDIWIDDSPDAICFDYKHLPIR